MHIIQHQKFNIRSNGVFKQNYTAYKKLGVPAAIEKIKEYMRDQDCVYNKASEDAEEESVSKKMMLEAEAYYEAFKHLFLPKAFRKNRHRSVVKEEYGIRRGIVKTVIAVPLPVAKDMSREDFAAAAGTFQHQIHPIQHQNLILADIYARRNGLDWDSFDQFSTDTQSLALFIEKVYDSEESSDWFAVCSCEVGLRGNVCLHAVAIYFHEGKMVPLSKQPKVKRFSRAQAKVPHPKKKSNKQVRF